MHEQILQRYKPKGWKLVQSRHRAQGIKEAEETFADGRRKHRGVGRANSAESDPNTKTITGPVVDDAATLFSILHEFAHVRLEHWGRGESCLHREEYEAERWAATTMAAEGIPVPRWVIKWGKNYIRHCIKLDEAKGLKIHSPARRFIR